MSLGPVNEGRQRIAGAIFLLLLAGGALFIMFASGRSLGSGVRLEVELASPGLLRSGARVRIAGREAGEVRGLRGFVSPKGEPHVVADCFVRAEWAPHLRRNSDYFVATPSILGEAFLEVGPPRSGEPGPPIVDGERVRGVDPPDLNRLLPRIYADLTSISATLREERPVIDEFLAAADRLLDTIDDVKGKQGQLQRVVRRATEAVDKGVEIARLLDETAASPRIGALARDLSALVARTGPELDELTTRANRAVERIDDLSSLWTPEERRRARRAFEQLEHAVTVGKRVAEDARRLMDAVERGRGTVGAFLNDREIYEDFHEVHRILKSRPWRFIIKSGDR